MNQLTHFKSCYNLGQNVRFSQCIDIDTRIIQTDLSKECCTQEKGKYVSKTNLCINPINSNYGICCMKHTTDDSIIGIWSNFTLVEGFMAHNTDQVNCAKKHRKHNPNKLDKVKTQNLPILDSTKSTTNKKKKSAYNDLD